MENNVYDVSLQFFDKIKSLPEKIRNEIIDQIEYNLESFIDLPGYTQTIGGVVKGDKPFFFEIEYIKEPNTPTIILELEEISLDNYLDYIDEEKKIGRAHV